MKHVFIIIISAGVLSCGSQNERSGVSESNVQASNVQDSTAIMQNFKKQEECWNSQDLECYVEAYYPSQSVQTVSRAGVTKGYDAILKDYQKYFPKDRMGKLHFDQMELKRLSDEYYYVVGRFNLTYQVPDTMLQGWFSVLLEKIDGSWYMISDHSS
ncbi:MAG: hypothetical protein NXI10_14070 [bacterium]|nr:hypothetical protein [bacterium]